MEVLYLPQIDQGVESVSGFSNSNFGYCGHNRATILDKIEFSFDSLVVSRFIKFLGLGFVDGINISLVHLPLDSIQYIAIVSCRNLKVTVRTRSIDAILE